MTIKASHNGLTVVFNPKYHSYSVKETGQKLLAATRFISDFFPRFDTDNVAARTGLKRGVDPEILKAEWKAKGEKAIIIGKEVHAQIESLVKIPKRTSYQFRVLGENEICESDVVSIMQNKCLQAQESVNALKRTSNLVEAEKIIFSPSIGIAGTVDCILQHRSNPLQKIIVDWKTNENLTADNPWQTGLLPLEHLDNSNLNKYALQLSLYQYILESENYYPESTFDRLVVHIGEDFHSPYKIDYLKNEIESMLI
uniref:Putative PD-(D/E)XK nuclease superfamily protein n=1 Tax=viral metagenome TaxID=1070528 RepID=A0A6M3IK74_9ZZZZ